MFNTSRLLVIPSRFRAHGPAISGLLALLVLALAETPARAAVPRFEVLPRAGFVRDLVLSPVTYASAGTPEGFVFLAHGPRGLSVLDGRASWARTNPPGLAVLGLEGWCRQLVVAGNQLLVAAGPAGLHVVDVSTPASPALLGSLLLEHEVIDVAGRPGLAVIADDRGSVHVIDTSAPAAPRRLGSLPLTRGAPEAPRLALTGNLLLVATRTRGLTTIDLTDPANPRVLGELLTGGGAVAVQSTGRYAWVGGGARNVVTVDLADPARPVALSVVGIPWLVASLAVADGWLHVANIYGGIHTFRLSDPTHPEPANQRLGGNPLGASPLEVSNLQVVGPRAFLSIGDSLAFGFLSWRLDAGVQAVPECQWSLVGIDGLAAAGDLACTVLHRSGSWFSAEGPGELTVVDLAAVPRPRVRGRLTGWWGGLTMDAGVLYSPVLWPAPVVGGVEIVSLADPDHPRRITTYRPDLYFGAQLAVSGGYLFATCGSGVIIADVHDPAHPVPVFQLNRSGDVPALRHHSGRLGYAWRSDGRFTRIEFLDVTDPARPQTLGSLDYANTSGTPTEVQALEFDDQVAFVLVSTIFFASGPQGARLDCLSLADPKRPVRIGSLELPGFPLFRRPEQNWPGVRRPKYASGYADLHLRNGFVYLATEGGGLRIVDVRDPVKPQIVSGINWADGIFFGTSMLAGDSSRMITTGSAGFAVLSNLPGLIPSYRLRDLTVGKPCTIEASDTPDASTGWTMSRYFTPSTTEVTFTESPPDGAHPDRRFYRASQKP